MLNRKNDTQGESHTEQMSQREKITWTKSHVDQVHHRASVT